MAQETRREFVQQVAGGALLLGTQGGTRALAAVTPAGTTDFTEPVMKVVI